MIISNPQNLAPVLAAMRAELKADMDALTLGVQQSNSSLAQTMATEFDAITAVNGEISTEVQAINAHTTSELGNLSLSPIKNIYRISSTANSANITIPEVNVDKTVINSCREQKNGYVGAVLENSTTVSISAYNGYLTHVEVVEYA